MAVVRRRGLQSYTLLKEVLMSSIGEKVKKFLLVAGFQVASLHILLQFNIFSPFFLLQSYMHIVAVYVKESMIFIYHFEWLYFMHYHTFFWLINYHVSLGTVFDFVLPNIEKVCLVNLCANDLKTSTLSYIMVKVRQISFKILHLEHHLARL